MNALISLDTRAASIKPRTLNKEAGTVEVTLSTGAPVRRAGFIERLALGPENVTLAPRIPVLDAHRQSSIADIKGRVADVRHEGGVISATLNISDPVALDAIERGDVTGVSIGYRVNRWAESIDPSTRERTRTATAWDLVEVSLVPVPADPLSLIRSITLPEMIQADPGQPVILPAANMQRAETRTSIRAIARQAGLDAAWADAQIDADADVTTARAAAFEAMQQRSEASANIRVQIGTQHDAPEAVRERQVEALASRMGGPAASDAARPYMAWGLADYARDAVTRSGAAGVGMLSREALLERAAHTTSDFPTLLTASGNRVLSAAYTVAQSPLKAIAKQRTADDFRALSVLRVGEFGTLQDVTESGEIKSTTTSEVTEGYSLSTSAAIFSLSRKAKINDDLNAFGAWSTMMGQAAAETEARKLFALLTQASGAGPKMSDGVTLFHANHGNLAAAGAAISDESLSAARLALRTMTGVDGKTPIGVTPKYLLVGPELETTAEKWLASINPTGAADVNPFSAKLQLLVEPRLTGNAWFVFADPAAMPVLEYAYLSSAQGPQLASREGWEVLATEYRVVLDFGCGATDWRGAYRNPGA